jgi:hypothetical protein
MIILIYGYSVNVEDEPAILGVSIMLGKFPEAKLLKLPPLLGNWMMYLWRI